MAESRCVLPDAALLNADPAWRCIDLISDVHLCAQRSATFDAWASFMQGSKADAVLILGDLFEFWPGDDAATLPFENRCLQLLAERARRSVVAVMVGNRDFLLTPALLATLGVQYLADPTLLVAWQQRLLLSHGDALCLDDVDYQKFRLWARSPATQREFLSRPLAERIRLAASFRHASEAGRQQAASPAAWADVDVGAAVACLRAAGTTRLLHGHTHRPGDSPLADGCDRLVLSDWDLEASPPRAEVLRLRREGPARLAAADTL
jgi:UDP-2,3-diacylglucosamine hydrolase